MNVAGGSGLGSFDEYFVSDINTAVGGNFAGLKADIYSDNTVGGLKIHQR